MLKDDGFLLLSMSRARLFAYVVEVHVLWVWSNGNLGIHFLAILVEAPK